MNAVEAQMLLRHWVPTSHDVATADDWAKELATFPLFAGVGRPRHRPSHARWGFCMVY